MIRTSSYNTFCLNQGDNIELGGAIGFSVRNADVSGNTIVNYGLSTAVAPLYTKESASFGGNNSLPCYQVLAIEITDLQGNKANGKAVVTIVKESNVFEVVNNPINE